MFVDGVEGDVHGEGLALLVFHFGFGEGGLADGAPLRGSELADDDSGLSDAAEGADDSGLGFGAHGFVGVVPFAHDAHADEVGALAVDLLFGEGAALGAEVGVGVAGDFVLLHLALHGQAVAVPAGQVGRVVSGEVFGADDEVLEAFVDGVSDVDVAVGVGRPVVEDEAGAAGCGLSEAVVEVVFFPEREGERFPPREVPAHRKRRSGQVERVGVGRFFRHRDSGIIRERGRKNQNSRPPLHFRGTGS